MDAECWGGEDFWLYKACEEIDGARIDEVVDMDRGVDGCCAKIQGGELEESIWEAVK